MAIMLNSVFYGLEPFWSGVRNLFWILVLLRVSLIYLRILLPILSFLVILDNKTKKVKIFFILLVFYYFFFFI